MSGHERQSIFRSEIFPSVGIFVGLIVAMLLLDGLLHSLDLVWIGRYLGIPGTILILVALQYSLHKHKIVVSGDPRALLRRHELLAWIGALMVLVHAGVHFNAILPWLALGAMLVNVASGLTGKYLLGPVQAAPGIPQGCPSGHRQNRGRGGQEHLSRRRRGQPDEEVARRAFSNRPGIRGPRDRAPSEHLAFLELER